MDTTFHTFFHVAIPIGDSVTLSPDRPTGEYRRISFVTFIGPRYVPTPPVMTHAEFEAWRSGLEDEGFTMTLDTSAPSQHRWTTDEPFAPPRSQLPTDWPLAQT